MKARWRDKIGVTDNQTDRQADEMSQTDTVRGESARAAVRLSSALTSSSSKADDLH